MHNTLRLPEPFKPAGFHVPFSACATVCFCFCLGLSLFLVALANGDSANTDDQFKPVSTAALVNPPTVATLVGSTLSVSPRQIKTALEVRARPKSIARNFSHIRLLKRQAHLPSYAGNSAEMQANTVTVGTDRRLQYKGNTWKFSETFTSKVGADPWAFAGVGFPNIETHEDVIENNHKRFVPLVDWASVDAKNDEWAPIPAVRCMGLSAQKIATRAKRHERDILSYSIQYGISASLIKALITQESCFDTKAVSSVGAEGLMQLMPDTANWLKVKNRADVSQNLAAGIRYLADLRKRFGSEELALAAYNAGPGNVERYGGIPPFKETQQYVKSVMTFYKRYVAATRFANQRVSI